MLSYMALAKVDNFMNHVNSNQIPYPSSSCSSRSTPIVSIQLLTATIMVVLLFSVMSLMPASASNTNDQAELNTLDSDADGATHELDIDQVTLYSAAALGSTFLLLFVIRLIRLSSKKKQTDDSTKVKPNTAESVASETYVAAKCGPMWGTPVGRKDIVEPQVAEHTTTESIASETFVAAKCEPMWREPVNRNTITEPITTEPTMTKTIASESFIAARCSSMWDTPVSRKEVTESEASEPTITKTIVSTAFVAAKCGSMWQTPVSRQKVAVPALTEYKTAKPIVSESFVAAKCEYMWSTPVSRQRIVKSFIAASCGPMWSQARPEATINTAESNDKNKAESKANNKAEVNKEELITLLKKHQKPGESLQATLDRLKESRRQRKKDDQQNPSVSKEELITLLKTQQKQGEALQATLDRIRESKRPQESDTQVILRLCKS